MIQNTAKRFALQENFFEIVFILLIKTKTENIGRRHLCFFIFFSVAFFFVHLFFFLPFSVVFFFVQLLAFSWGRECSKRRRRSSQLSCSWALPQCPRSTWPSTSLAWSPSSPPPLSCLCRRARSPSPSPVQLSPNDAAQVSFCFFPVCLLWCWGSYTTVDIGAGCWPEVMGLVRVLRTKPTLGNVEVQRCALLQTWKVHQQTLGRVQALSEESSLIRSGAKFSLLTSSINWHAINF